MAPITRAIVRRCPVDVDAELLTAREAGRITRAAGFEWVGLEYFLYFPERLFSRLAPIEKALGKVPFGGQHALLAQLPE